MSTFKNNLSGEVCEGTGDEVGRLLVVEAGAGAQKSTAAVLYVCVCLRCSLRKAP